MASPAGTIDLVVLAPGEKSAACRLLADGTEVTFRGVSLRDAVPGEIATLKPGKDWTEEGRRYLTGRITGVRIDAPALGLVPLRLEDRGAWDPLQHFGIEEGEPVADWARPIIARGPRPQFEMENVPPFEPDRNSSAVDRAIECAEGGKVKRAYRMLVDVCCEDMRSLDAHAHMGTWTFQHSPEFALSHYQLGVAIGELSLGKDFEGVLPWGFIDNRPFLRCMHGYGLSLWRLGIFRAARETFERMLWLNPEDNQGVRFIIPEVIRKVRWEDSAER